MSFLLPGEPPVEPFEDRRQHVRLRKQFRLTITLSRLSREEDGETENLSQGGALVSTPPCSNFERKDQVTVNLFLPPEMTGQKDILVLTGPAIVKRVDNKTQRLALQFSKELRTFRVAQPDSFSPASCQPE